MLLGEVGLQLGTLLGVPDGSIVGMLLGIQVGSPEGAPDGRHVGELLGEVG